MVTSTGEVAEFREADQFQPAKSQFECGYFACAIAKSMAQPGQPPTLSVAQIISDAESWYAQYDGTDAISNVNGMTLEQEYQLLQQIGLHYQAIALDINQVMAWVKAGYPVIIAITEISAFDYALGRNPYTAWAPAGTHVILVTGVTADGNILVRDSANCTNLYDPNSLRPGPRKYSAAKLQLVSATVVVPPWLSRPTSAIAPTTTGEINMDISNPFASAHFTQTSTDPSRWHCAKTGQDLFAGILAGWQAMNGAPRLPTGPEVSCGKRAVYQKCESGVVVYDPDKELDAPGGPWAPCYLLKFDSDLAKKLLGTITPTQPATNADMVTHLKNILSEVDAALKDEGQ